MRHTTSILAMTVALVLPSAAQDGNWQADAIAAAKAFHAANLPEQCAPPNTDSEPSNWQLQIGEETAARQALLIEFACRTGAYNQTAVYLMSDQHGTVTEVLFASPLVDVIYAAGSDDAVVEKIVITATPWVREVVNPSYDADSRTMSERDKWRGRDDAYGATQWGYRQGRFEIMQFAVDASFDGKDNPQILIENQIW